MNDTIRSFQSFIESQISDVSSGVVRQNLLSNDKLECPAGSEQYPGASDKCIVMGKLIVFGSGGNSELKVYNVVGNIKPTPLTCPSLSTGTGVDKVRQYCPRVLEMAEPAELYAPEWAAETEAVSFRPLSVAVGAPKNTMSILRDPSSDFVYTSAFNTTATVGELKIHAATEIDPDYTNSQGVVCLNMGGFPALKGYVLFTGGSGIGSIKSNSSGTLPAGLSCP